MIRGLRKGALIINWYRGVGWVRKSGHVLVDIFLLYYSVYTINIDNEHPMASYLEGHSYPERIVSRGIIFEVYETSWRARLRLTALFVEQSELWLIRLNHTMYFWSHSIGIFDRLNSFLFKPHYFFDWWIWNQYSFLITICLFPVCFSNPESNSPVHDFGFYALRLFVRLRPPPPRQERKDGCTEILRLLARIR